MNNVKLPSGWEKDDKGIGSRYTYWSDNAFASVDVSNSMHNPKELQVIVNMIDKVHKDSAMKNYKVTVRDVDTDWNRVVQDAINNADAQLREMVSDSTDTVMHENISERQIAQVLQDAREQSEDFGITAEFTPEYYIGNAVSAAGYPLDKLFMFLPDHVSETDKEYRDAFRGWKENEGIDSSSEDNFIPDDDM